MFSTQSAAGAVLLAACREAPTTEGPPEYGEYGTEYQGGIDVWTGAEVLAGAPGRPVVLDATDCGHEVLGPGDQDGDGVPDVAIACGWLDQVLYTLSGADLVQGVATEIRAVAMPQPFETPEILGDLDGDGLGEIGLEGQPPAETASLREWGRVLPAAVGSGDAQDLAWRLLVSGGSPNLPASAAGDVDGDGVPDVAIAELYPTPERDAGLYVVSGAALGARAWGSAFDAAAGSVLALSVSGDDGPPTQVVGVGDLDGDGRSDLAVATDPWRDGPEREAPVVSVVLSGSPVAALDAAPRLTVNRGKRSGATELAPLGDLDGDGRGELAIRMELSRTGADWFGVAVVPGAAIPTTGTLSLEPYLLAEVNVEELEPCDLDGDGLPELVTPRRIWAGVDLLTPAAPWVEPWLQSGRLACLGDLDGDGTSELGQGNPYLQPVE